MILLPLGLWDSAIANDVLIQQVQTQLNIFYKKTNLYNKQNLFEDGVYGDKTKDRVIAYKQTHDIEPADDNLSIPLLKSLGLVKTEITTKKPKEPEPSVSESTDPVISTEKDKTQPVKMTTKPIIRADNVNRNANPLYLTASPEMTTIHTVQADNVNRNANQAFYSASVDITNNNKIMLILDGNEPDVLQANDRQFVIGIVATRGTKKAKKKWQKLINYLSKNIPNVYLKPQYGTLKELYKMNNLDYLLGNPKLSVEYEQDSQFRPIATLLNLRQGEKYDQFGSVLISRTDSKYQSVADMDKNTVIGCVNVRAWGGWVLNHHYLKFTHNFDSFKDAKSVDEFHSHDKVVKAVLDGNVDIGSIRTDTLERMSQEGLIDLDDINVLNPNVQYGDKFKFKLTTALYPEWPFLAGPETPDLVNKRIAGLLLRLTEKDIASKAGKNAGWTIPANYQGVHNVLRDLRLPPYQYYGEITLTQTLKKYWYIWLILLFGMMVIIFSIGLYLKNSRKIEVNRHLFEMRTKQVESEKMATIGQMVAGTAHEINTPLGFLSSNMQMIESDLKYLSPILQNLTLEEVAEDEQERIREAFAIYDEKTLQTMYEQDEEDYSLMGMVRLCNTGIANINEHILHLKNYSRQDRGHASPTDINMLITGVLIISKNKVKKVTEVIKNYDQNLSDIVVVPDKLRQVINNLLSNALYAMEDRHEKELEKNPNSDYHGKLIIKTELKNEDHVLIHVIDNGQGIKLENISHIFDEFYTTKGINNGVGLGLATCKKFIEKIHHGKLTVHSEYGVGTMFSIELPIKHDSNHSTK